MKFMCYSSSHNIRNTGAVKGICKFWSFPRTLTKGRSNPSFYGRCVSRIFGSLRDGVRARCMLEPAEMTAITPRKSFRVLICPRARAASTFLSAAPNSKRGMTVRGRELNLKLATRRENYPPVHSPSLKGFASSPS